MTIGAAIAVAQNGDTIRIKNGTYAPAWVSAGYFYITKRLTLEAYAGHSPVLTYGTTAGGTINNPIIYMTQPCTLRGLNIVGTYALGQGSQFAECNVYAETNLTMENCTLTDFNHCGLKVVGGTSHTITNNVINGGGYTSQDHCIYHATHSAGAYTYSNNELTGAAGWGLHLYNYEYDAAITSNNIHDNDNGGLLLTGENHTVTGNTITANGTGGGIRYYHSAVNLTVTNNTLSGNGTYDQLADFSAGEGFVNCTISGNSGTRNF